MARNFFSGLPSDVLLLILRLLSIADYVRSGAVCTSWFRITAGNPHRRNAEVPLLILPSDDEDSDSESFTSFSITDGTSRSISLPQIHGNLYSGSSHGFIMALDICFPDSITIIVVNPLTGAQLHLPLLTEKSPSGAIHFPLITNLVFSPSACVAVAIHLSDDGVQSFSYARIGDDSWTVLMKQHMYCSFLDVILHKGEFIMLTSSGSLRSFDHNGHETFTFFGCRFSFFDDDDRIYLVESVDGAHLLLLRRIMHAGYTKSFRIYKRDPTYLWSVEVERLGEAAIFVGSNFSMCLFTRGLPGLRGNSVYFYFTERNKYDFGVFNLGDGSMEQLDPFLHIRSNGPPPFWIMPTSS